MINASKEFKQKLKDGANIVNYADVTLADGTVLHLTYKDFMVGGCSIEDKATDGKFGVGFCIGKTLAIKLANHDERFSRYDFYGATIHLYVALLLDDGTIEKLRKGIYYAMVPSTPGDIIKISAVDGMYRLDRDYSASTTIYPATLQTILTEACLDCGIPIGFRQFDNMGFIVQARPEKATYRQVVSWACQIAGYNARIDNAGYMELIWYNTNLLSWNHYDGGDFRTYPHDTIIDGGNFTDYSTGTIISGGTFTDEIPEHIFQIKSLEVHTDDVQITGVRVAGNEDALELFGEDGYVIEVKDNPFAAGKERSVADYLGGRMVGMMFRPFSAQVLGNPLYEPFDIVRVSDKKGNSYNSLINSVSYTVGAYTQISCEAEDPLRNGSTYFSEAAAAVVEARRNAEEQLTEYDKAVQNMNQLAGNALGYHTTYEEQPDGSRITYLHDRPSLKESKTIFKQTIDGFFISTDGGKTYTAGFDSQGNAVVNILYAIGIVADWIRTGRFQVRKGDQVTFLADADTGEVRIVADSFTLSSGQTIDSIAQDKASTAVNDFVTAVYDPKVASLQSQIDGQIETWYYDYQPTLSNAPASSWKTEADRAKHEGDLFYWKSKGYSYRFFKDGSAWKWQLITDSDITKALADAATAQDTADNKRRVFVTTPKPPYDVGDLWFAGGSSDIMTCMTARASGSYVASDWQKRNKYIDQSAANAAAKDAVDAQTQLSIFNKLTNNGEVQGIYLSGNKLYINGEYIKSKTIAADKISVSDLNAFRATIAGWNMNSRQIYKSVDLYEDMSASGLSGVGSNDPVRYYVIIGAPQTGTDSAFFIGYEKKSEFLNNLGLVYPIFSAKANGTVTANSFNSNNANITGGQIRINSNSSYKSLIDLKYSDYEVTISPSIIAVQKGETATTIQPTGIFTSGTITVNGKISMTGDLTMTGNFYAGGTKNRVVDTEDYSTRLLYCYETSKPCFGDIGEAMLDEDGICYIFLDDIFAETVNTDCQYQVFLQKYGQGEVWVEERRVNYFIVRGTPNLRFGWEIKARQLGFETECLEKFSREEPEPSINYETEAQNYIDDFYKEALDYEDSDQYDSSDDSRGEADFPHVFGG